MSIKGRVLRKVLSEAQKLIHKKKSKTIQQLSVKGVHKDVPLRVSSDKQVKTFKQKPKIGGGAETHPQQLSYGVGAKEHKINQKLTSIATRRPAYKGAHHLDESWRSEMNRLYGGIHMSQDPKKIKKSIKMLTKKLKKKKVIKALRGTLIKKGTKLAYKLATQKYPQVFKKKRFAVAEYKAQKIRKTP